MNIWTVFIAVTLVAFVANALWRTRDTFHPAVLVGPMLGFLYVYLPVQLSLDDGFRGYLTDEQVDFAQRINLGGILAFIVGVSLAARERAAPRPSPLTAEGLERLRRGAVAIGGLGLIAYVINIANVGGFSAAYGRAYGGGWSDSGYLRDSVMLALPSTILLALLGAQRPTMRRLVLIAALSLPLVLQGLFGARRGPTFMALAGVGVAYYLGRMKRPRLVTLAAAGGLVGLLLLFLVSNRQAIYVGSEERLDQDVGQYLRPGTGNEFIYGAGTIVHYELTGRYMMGARYFAVFFVRPIPRALWPNKYVWVSALFDVPNLEQNLGMDAAGFHETLGWKGALGAAPGIVADMFVEFGYGYPVALLLIGALYGFAWRRATHQGGVWLPLYCLLAALSLYLVMQSLEAMAFRFLLTGAATVVVWRWAAARAEDSRGLPQGAVRV